jgi:sulfur carrier protein
MTLIINGEEQDVAAKTLADLLHAHDNEGEWLATADNGDLLHREDRAAYPLGAFDRIEILSPMQGG